MGHQGISKVVARMKERHTWPGIRRSVGRYVGQCLTCQQVRDKPGDVRFQLKNIQSGYFNELVQYDHLKICPSDNNNTGILVIIDHFVKFAEAVPFSHHNYDAVTTSRLLLQKWFARHGTPTRMQSDNAPNLTAEVSNEFLKAAHVTKVTSTAGHWMDTRLPTKLRAGGSRLHYQQFDYSTSGTDDELSDVMLIVPPDPVDADQAEPEAPLPSSDQSVSPTHRLPQLFSDHERARSPSPQVSTSEKESSLLGTSAPLLTNPSLTDFLSNYPIWPTAPPIPLKSASSESDDQSNVPSVPSALPGAGTAPSFKRGSGRPPKAQKKRLVRAKAKTRKKEAPPKVETEVSANAEAPAETEAPRSAEARTEAPTASEAPRYQLRSERQPRYKCGSCGLRDCVCLLAVNENRGVPTGAREVPPEGGKIWCTALR